MITVQKGGVILEKTNLVFENQGVLNPGAIREGTSVHLFYRAVSNGNHSSIGYCKLEGHDCIVQRNEKPLLYPEHAYEAQGIEDPRIVKIDGIYYLTYTAYDGINALGALATSEDLIHFKKYGIIVPQLSYFAFERLTHIADQVEDRYWTYFNSDPLHKHIDRNNLIWDKNVVFFPRRINGQLCFLHRIKPDIQLVTINRLSELTPEFWENYILNLDKHTVLAPKFEHEINYIGSGAPPIETSIGWLLIYHGVNHSVDGNRYVCCAALLDLEHPQKELARLNYPLFEPEFIWERKGEVDNVCFPCGTVLFDDELTIYYGAADEQIAHASLSLSELLAELKLSMIDETLN